MDTKEIAARLKALKARLGGDYSFVHALISEDESFYVSASLSGMHQVYKGRGNCLETLLDECQTAIDERDPALLARTLGVEVAA
jgi:hypothetical protein